MSLRIEKNQDDMVYQAKGLYKPKVDDTEEDTIVTLYENYEKIKNYHISYTLASEEMSTFLAFDPAETSKEKAVLQSEKVTDIGIFVLNKVSINDNAFPYAIWNELKNYPLVIEDSGDAVFDVERYIANSDAEPQDTNKPTEIPWYPSNRASREVLNRDAWYLFENEFGGLYRTATPKLEEELLYATAFHNAELNDGTLPLVTVTFKDFFKQENVKLQPAIGKLTLPTQPTREQVFNLLVKNGYLHAAIYIADDVVDNATVGSLFVFEYSVVLGLRPHKETRNEEEALQIQNRRTSLGYLVVDLAGKIYSYTMEQINYFRESKNPGRISIIELSQIIKNTTKATPSEGALKSHLQFEFTYKAFACGMKRISNEIHFYPFNGIEWKVLKSLRDLTVWDEPTLAQPFKHVGKDKLALFLKGYYPKNNPQQSFFCH
ncbi:hypothetical protein LX64_02634 [Chitinophaga skermanii]|uniref:Uncharacterized protein n=1 Tax=Chitinophaga skermanii TaxID=331697 RepID=A0A327QLC8_9BACT|nr:hypothetical protein [Chitinophaga skermanii]RAJ05476.1 hypothetical protein LX64_02634 [Chitinophaga skermanii]